MRDLTIPRGMGYNNNGGRDVLCPYCGKRLARARNGVEFLPNDRGPLLLWCKGCRTEIPFDTHDPRKPYNLQSL
jgi:hypothetical protein